MQTYFNWLRDNQGNVVAGGQVAVYDANTSNLSAIYVPTNDGNATVPKPNPFTSDPNGYFEFSCPNGDYQLVFSGGNLATTIVRNVNIWDGGSGTGGPMTNPMSNIGEFIYGGVSGTPTAGAANTTTTPKYLREVGNGTVASPPAWAQIPASEVSTQQPQSGATVRLQSGKNAESISAFDFMSEAQIADVRARTLTLDCTTALQAAIDAASDYAGGTKVPVTLYLPAGAYKTTATLHMRPYMQMRGDGLGRTTIYPFMSSGAALSSDATSGVEEAYLVQHQGFMIDGTNCTGTASAWYFKTNKNSQFTQVGFWNFSNVNNGVPPVNIDGACYNLRFVQCNWYLNKSHLKSVGDGGSSFSTSCAFEGCLFEGALDATALEASSGILLKDVLNFCFSRCIIQGNKSYESLRISNSLSTLGEHIIDKCYFEGNGTSALPETPASGVANTSAISIAGVAGKPVTGVIISSNAFHQLYNNIPNYQIRLTYTNKTRISDNREGFGGTFVKDSGNNTNVWLDTRSTSPGEFGNAYAPAAWVVFDGKTGGVATVKNSFNVSGVVRNAVGNYTITFANALKSNFCISVCAEDNAATGSLVGSSGVTSGTTTVIVYTVAPATGALNDARTCSVIVFSV